MAVVARRLLPAPVAPRMALDRDAAMAAMSDIAPPVPFNLAAVRFVMVEPAAHEGKQRHVKKRLNERNT